MKPALVLGIALLLVLVAALAVFAFVMPMFAPQPAAQNYPGGGPGYGRGMMGGGNYGSTQPYTGTAPYGGGRGMGRGGMMGGGNTQPGGLAPVNPPTNAPQANPAPQSATTPQAPAASNAPANSATQKAGNWNVTLAMTPYPPVSFQTTTFNITITDEKGAAISDAQVSLDLTMPSMWMPSNKPQAQSLGSGKYQATGKFTMRGGWQIAVIVQRGGEKQTAYFELGL